MQTETTKTESPTTTRLLWVSACVLALIVVFQLGWIPERRAEARGANADVATSGEFTMMNLRTSNEDILLVLDSRNETLFAYHVRNQSMFEVLTGGDVKGLFDRGRRIGAGVK